MTPGGCGRLRLSQGKQLWRPNLFPVWLSSGWQPWVLNTAQLSEEHLGGSRRDGCAVQWQGWQQEVAGEVGQGGGGCGGCGNGALGAQLRRRTGTLEVAWSGVGRLSFSLTAHQEMRKQEMSSPTGGN